VAKALVKPKIAALAVAYGKSPPRDRHRVGNVGGYSMTIDSNGRVSRIFEHEIVDDHSCAFFRKPLCHRCTKTFRSSGNQRSLPLQTPHSLLPNFLK
jgi:hypothetical protein